MQVLNPVYSMQPRKYTSTQSGEGPQSSSQFSRDQLGQAGSLLRNTSQWLLAGWPFWSGARPEVFSSVTLEGSSAAVKPLLGLSGTLSSNCFAEHRFAWQPETAQGLSPKSFIYASQEGFGEDRAMFHPEGLLAGLSFEERHIGAWC